MENKFLIVGLGLIGGSYADALTSLGYEVGAICRSQDKLDYALSKNFVKSGITNIDPSYISQFDVVIFGLYPNDLINWIKENQQYLKKGAILTDCSGVKGCVVEPIQKILREDLEFLGTHPMAGKAESGLLMAEKGIFKNANFIITPTEKNSKNTIDFFKNLAIKIGCKEPEILTPKKHDEMIAFLSQLCHVIAVSLMDCKDSTSLIKYTGDSFRDLTRIANINAPMWSELFLENKEELLKHINLFENTFIKLKNLIEREDSKGIMEMMELSKKRRILFDKDKK